MKLPELVYSAKPGQAVVSHEFGCFQAFVNSIGRVWIIPKVPYKTVFLRIYMFIKKCLAEISFIVNVNSAKWRFEQSTGSQVRFVYSLSVAIE